MMHTGGKVRSAVLAVMIAGAGCLAVGLISGLLYEQSQRARDRQRLPQVGRTVDIGGRSLNLFCSGTGQPAVVFESGATWPLYTTPKAMFENGSPRPGYIWVAIQRDLAKLTTACWYDRAGSGWSELGPYPRDSGAQARDLHALLRAAGVAGPYVLVAESSAALDARVYARQYRAEVAGLVFVNGAHPDLFGERRGRRRARIPGFVLRSQDVAAQFFNAVGLYRLGPVNDAPARPAPAGVTEQEWAAIWRMTKGSRAKSALSCRTSRPGTRARPKRARRGV